MAIFELKPPEEELDQWASKYWKKNPEKEEADAFEAGKKIAGGDFASQNLVKIVHWKSPRVVPLVLKNDEVKIESALRDAIANRDEPRKAIQALKELRGVGVPVASAILTAVFPDRYTVIDFRALEALGHRRDEVDFYEVYLTSCAALAADLAHRNFLHIQENYPAPTLLRALDRALWQWSESKGNLESE